MENNESVKSNSKAKKIIGLIVDVLAVIIFALVLYISIEVLVAKSKNLKYVPIFGNAYVTVQSDSMKGTNKDSFEKGDLLVVKLMDKSQFGDIKVGDTITYEGLITIDNNPVFALITHRVTDINVLESGEIDSFMTRGDAALPGTQDEKIEASEVIGKVISINRGAGSFMDFLSSSTGFLIFIVIPALLVVAYCIVLFVINYKQLAKEKALEGEKENLSKLEQEKAERERLEAEKEELLKKLAEMNAKQADSGDNKKDNK